MLRIGALDAPGQWASALERGGYRIARRFLLMRAPLLEAPEPPVWPPGYALRPFRRDAEARAVHAAFADGFADHFGPPYDPYDTWFHKLFVQPALAFRDDLMLVAWNGDEVAGALVAAETSAETADGGYVGELVVRRAHRRQGLGRALLLESFAPPARPRPHRGAVARRRRLRDERDRAVPQRRHARAAACTPPG